MSYSFSHLGESDPTVWHVKRRKPVFHLFILLLCVVNVLLIFKHNKLVIKAYLMFFAGRILVSTVFVTL